MSRLRRDRRAVSVTVGYVLMLAIAALLMGTLLTAGSGVIEGRSQQVVDDQLTVIGTQVAANIHEADRLAQVANADATRTSATGRMRLEVRLPQQVAGTGYRINITDTTIILRSSNPNVDVRVNYPQTVTNISTPGQLTGGDMRIVYNTSADLLRVEQ